MSIGERLKKAREAKGLTQSQLAKMLNVSDVTISRYENNTRSPDADMLRRLADILSVSADYLIGRTDYVDTAAAHRSDDAMADLPEEALKSLSEFEEYIRQKYGKKG
jgi:transcriptional regulator with XRE-family HTH domain